MMKLAVWLTRLLVGAVFILSGVSKMVDPTGFAIKISSYLAAWGIDDMVAPGLTLIGGCLLSGFEFLTGIMLASGSLRRTSARCALLLMCGMLPLSAYIAIANPVDDCGCFGDLLIISNTATFLKNLVLFALCIFLVRYNRRATTLFAPWIQWVEATAAVLYIIILAVVGYHEQPLLDFRPYPVGEPLIADEDPEGLYVYVRNGEEKTFSDTELPADDSGWEFKEVRLTTPPSAKQFAMLDRRSGRDVTDSITEAAEDLMILLLPYPSEASAAGSYTANELNSAMTERYGPGAFIAVAARDTVALARALNVMMADYPIYYADRKAMMAVARGSMPVVYLRKGVVQWKRTLASINLDRITPEADLATVFATNGPAWFRRLTLLYLAANLAICIIGLIPALFRRKSSLQR